MQTDAPTHYEVNTSDIGGRHANPDDSGTLVLVFGKVFLKATVSELMDWSHMGLHSLIKGSTPLLWSCSSYLGS